MGRVRTRHDFSAEAYVRQLQNISRTDVMRHQYCLNIGYVFTAIGLLESTITSALWMCNLTHPKSLSRAGKTAATIMMQKRAALQDSTFGNLLNIVVDKISEEDSRYLKWLKSKRDYFIHRFFHEEAWPGNLDERDCEHLIRHLTSLNIIFSRGTHKIWKILGRNNLMIVDDLGEDGSILMNLDTFADDSEPISEILDT